MKIWLVNTNSKQENGNPNAFKQMLRQNKVAAFYDNKETVDKIKQDDMVLLYTQRKMVLGF